MSHGQSTPKKHHNKYSDLLETSVNNYSRRYSTEASIPQSIDRYSSQHSDSNIVGQQLENWVYFKILMRIDMEQWPDLIANLNHRTSTRQINAEWVDYIIF